MKPWRVFVQLEGQVLQWGMGVGLRGSQEAVCSWTLAAKGGLFLLLSLRHVDSHGAPSKHGGAEGTSVNEEVP